eukprot:TRINITY_DN20033_c0_g1_i2.p1 TRINITY_DN20033_c0_g1~~TRINITY_DN20033_c0_g1_i2.p1  ORF type:complete len:372 (+),score=74.63 TRINITY_DN20033_c0_g1_i2:92-1207(+)
MGSVEAPGLCFVAYARPDASVFRKARKRQRRAERLQEAREQPGASQEGAAEPRRPPASVEAYTREVAVRVERHAAVQAHNRELVKANAAAGVTTVVITYDTECFRDYVGVCVGEDDRVIDIGCSYGVCTALLAGRAAHTLGVDIAADMVAAARERHGGREGLAFDQVDILTEPAKAVAALADRNKIWMDIGGNRCVKDVVRAIDYLLRAKPTGLALIVVKSEELYKSYAKGEQKRGFTTRDAPAAPAGVHPERLMQGWWGALRQQHLSAADDPNAAPWEQAWFVRARAKGFLQHPFRYPNRAAPTGELKCRPYNYSAAGCKDPACRFDHVHCHVCDGEGHIGRECPRAHAGPAHESALSNPAPAKKPRTEG